MAAPVNRGADQKGLTHMRDDRLAWFGRLGKVIILLALIATLNGYDLSLTVDLKALIFSFSLTRN